MNLNFLALYTDHLLITLLIVTILAKFFRRLSGVQVFFAVFTAVISWLVGIIIKSFFWLPRPYLVSGQTPKVNFLLDGSFPSNHALFAFSLSLAVLTFNRRLGIFLLLLSFLIAAGRILAGVHSFFDVSGSFFLAVLLVFLLRKLIYSKLLG